MHVPGRSHKPQHSLVYAEYAGQSAEDVHPVRDMHNQHNQIDIVEVVHVQEPSVVRRMLPSARCRERDGKDDDCQDESGRRQPCCRQVVRCRHVYCAVVRPSDKCISTLPGEVRSNVHQCKGKQCNANVSMETSVVPKPRHNAGPSKQRQFAQVDEARCNQDRKPGPFGNCNCNWLVRRSIFCPPIEVPANKTADQNQPSHQERLVPQIRDAY